MMVCSSPADCAEIERRHATGIGLLVDGGASRGNLLSGEAEETILTVSRIEAEKRANPGYRAFLANGFNVTRALVLFVWEVVARGDRGAARGAARRAPARPPRRHLPADARRDVRVRPRPRRLRRAHRHDARAPRRLRDVRELRRGRAPLRARARRHARGAAQARPAVRAHRARAPLRAAPVRDRRALRPRADAGRDVQAAQRLRPRRARRALAGAARRSPAFAGGDEQHAMVGHAVGEATGRKPREAPEERRLRSRRRRARLGQPRARLPDGGAAPADARGDRGAPPASCSRRCASTRTSAGCSCARPTHGAVVLGPERRALPRRGARRGRGPARALLADRRAAPAAHATASRTSPTSWSAASTTRCSTRAARSRS